MRYLWTSAATNDSEAVAERSTFSAYLIVSAMTSMLIAPVFGRWARRSFLNGEMYEWLEKRGFLDSAGSTVVHSMGACGWRSRGIVVGPRIGRFDGLV